MEVRQTGRGMIWLEVQSSNIAAIGYDADIATLGVRYKDGAVYVRPNVTATQYGALMTAPSKGKFLAAMSGRAVRIEVMPHGNDAQPPGALNVIDEDADKCCRRAFSLVDAAKFPERLQFMCGSCGTGFRSEMVGPNRYWRITEHFAVVRPH